MSARSDRSAISRSNQQILNEARKQAESNSGNIPCHYCGIPMMHKKDKIRKYKKSTIPDNTITVDHVYPKLDVRAIFYPELRTVTVLCCYKCNQKRNDESQTYRVSEVNIFSILTTGRVVSCIRNIPRSLKAI